MDVYNDHNRLTVASQSGGFSLTVRADEGGQINPYFTLEWQLEAHLIAELEEKKSRKAMLLVVLRNPDGAEDTERRYLFPLRDKQGVIGTRKAGLSLVYAGIVIQGEFSDKSLSKLLVQDGDDRRTSCLSYRGGLENTSQSIYERGQLLNYGFQPMNRVELIDQACLPVEMPPELFRENHPVTVWLAQSLWPIKELDTCQVKRRAIINTICFIPYHLIRYACGLVILVAALLYAKIDIDLRPLAHLHHHSVFDIWGQGGLSHWSHRKVKESKWNKNKFHYELRWPVFEGMSPVFWVVTIGFPVIGTAIILINSRFGQWRLLDNIAGLAVIVGVVVALLSAIFFAGLLVYDKWSTGRTRTTVIKAPPTVEEIAAASKYSAGPGPGSKLVLKYGKIKSRACTPIR